MINVYPKELVHLLSPDGIKNILNDKQKTHTRYSNNLSKWFQITVHSFDDGLMIRLNDITTQMTANRLLRLNQFSVSQFNDMVLWFKHGGHIIYVN